MKWYKHDPDAALSGMVGLSLEERGAYYTIMDAFYSRDGNLPDDDYLVSKILGCHVRTWMSIKISLFKKQKIHVNELGNLVPNRGEETLREARRFAERQSKRSLTRWEKTENTSNNNESTMRPRNAITTTPTSTYKESCANAHETRARATPPESENPADEPNLPIDPPDETKPKYPDDWPDDFQSQFWTAYPHKVGKPKALLKLDRIARRGGVVWSDLMGGLRRYVSGKPPDRQWCNPETWLNQERWTDQPAFVESFPNVFPMRKENGSTRNPLMAAADKLIAELEQRERESGQVPHVLLPTQRCERS